MKLMVSSYNSGIGSWNKEEEETKLRTYTLDHNFNRPAECNIVLADVDGSLMRKYKTDTQVALAGGVADDGGVETDETTETNSAAANDMTLVPAVPVVNDAFYFGFDDQPIGFTLNVGTACIPGGVAWTITWEYSQGADAWAALAGVTDDTAGYQNAGSNLVKWTIPGDWATDEVGSIASKYWVRGRLSAMNVVPATNPIGTQAWYDKVWIGPGKVTLEDPTATDLFYGRIVRAVGNFDEKTLTLECKDWLDQLDEEQITYDMREKLGTTDMRQSMLRSDVDNGRVCVENDAGTFYAYDDGSYTTHGGMAFANDQHNGQYLFFAVEMAGKRTWTFHPYDSTPAGEDLYDDNVFTIWADDGFAEACSANNDFTLTYHFHVELGHNTPSDFYVHDSIESAKVICKHMISEVPSVNHAHIQIYDNDAAAFVDLTGELGEKDQFSWAEHPVPLDVLPYITDNTGEVDVRYDVDRTAGDAVLTLAYLGLEVTAETTPYSTPILINDTINPNKLEVATDLTAQATQVWEGIPYCIAKKRYLHFESATGIFLGGDNIVTLTAGAGDIEDTTGISTRQHKNRTRLQIAQAEAQDDKSVFWMALGGTTITYKQTFGANTETMTDATPDNWQSQRDYSSLVNSVDVYGARIGNYEIYQQSQDTDSITTYKATRSKVIRDAGLVTDADALAIGAVVAARDANISQMVGCTLSGFDTTYRLGTIVEITSSYLWDTAAKDYIVTRWAYDSVQHKTFLTLHPKVSIGLQEVKTLISEGATIKKSVLMNELDKVVNDPITHEVA